MRKTKIENSVSELYSKYPFPGIEIDNKRDLKKTLIYNLIYPLIKNYIRSSRNKKIKILDVGCGTGELPLSLALKNVKITAIDLSKNSIKEAKEKQRKLHLKNVTFKISNILKGSLPKKYFDISLSIGVIHHIPQSELALNKLVASTKIGGVVVIGVYNPFGIMRNRIRRKIVRLLAGDNIDDEVKMARKLFSKKETDKSKVINLADSYAHPYQRYFTIEKLLELLSQNNLEYIASTPPIELTKNIRLFIDTVNNLIQKKDADLVKNWNKTLSEINTGNPWERSRLFTFPLQVAWMIIGRGEMVNIVARRIK